MMNSPKFVWYKDRGVWVITVFFALLFALQMWALFATADRCEERGQRVVRAPISGFVTCVGEPNG